MTEELNENTSTELERGVPKAVRQQLAIDIDKAGGIQLFDKAAPQALDELLNNPDREDLYKARGHPLRKKIRGLVRDWKGWKKEKYFKKVFIPFVLKRSSAQASPDSPTSSSTTPSEPTPVASSPKETKRAAPTSNPEPAKKRVKAAPSSPRTNLPEASPKMTYNSNNKLGHKIIKKLPRGKYLCLLWNDKKQGTELQLYFGDDGCSVWQKTKEPRPNGGKDILAPFFDWGSDENNGIVMALDDELDQLKPEKGTDDRWDKELLFTLDEPILKTFVNEKGEAVTDDPYVRTIDGHKVICFFLKTLKQAQEEIRRAKPAFAETTTDGNADAPMEEDMEEKVDIKLQAVTQELWEQIQAEKKERKQAEFNRGLAEQKRREEEQRLREEEQRRQQESDQRQQFMFQKMQEMAEQQTQTQQALMMMMQNMQMGNNNKPTGKSPNEPSFFNGESFDASCSEL